MKNKNNDWMRDPTSRRYIEAHAAGLMQSSECLQQCIFLVLTKGNEEPLIVMVGKPSDPVFKGVIQTILAGEIPNPSDEQS